MKYHLYSFIRRIGSLVILFAISLASYGQGFGPETEARLQEVIDSIQNDTSEPFVGGMSVAVKVGDNFLWAGATGYAARNIDAQNNLLPGGIPFTTGTLSQIYSITKTFTAPLVLELAQEGVFSLDDPVSNYLPLSQINPRLNSEVTIRQLLAHESGFSDYAVEQQLQIAVAAQPGRIWSPFEAISFTNQIFPTGTERRYSSTNYILLGALVEVVTGKPIEQHYRERFFEPLGLESMYLGVREPLGDRGVLAAPHDNISPFNPVFAQTGQPTFPDAYTNISRFPMDAIVSLAFAGGGIVSNATDLAEWGDALFRGRATSQATLDMMLESISSSPDMNGNFLGYGIKQIPHISDSEVFLGHNGDAVGYRTVMVHQPERDVTLAVLSNFAGADPYAIARALYRALAPQISSFSPKQGLPGTTVTIDGKRLATTTSVRFNGVEADFTVISENRVTAVVPATASSGLITLEAAGGTAESKRSFTVLQPRIQAFYPDRGWPGSKVLLVGRHLGTTREVYFNGVKAEKFRTYFDFLVLAEVPQGATTGKISVLLSGGGQAYTSSDFTIYTIPLLAAKAEEAKSQSEDKTTRPEALIQEQELMAYPNPFTEHVTLVFTLAHTQPVNVKVYDIKGREVGVLYRGEAQGNSRYQLMWKPGKELSPGLYILRLQTSSEVRQQKIMLTK
ncbi:T9SS C-terminal target domain-containing protein [Pontibacter diazotrophicus]|uniref:T9SS C-terminal target domain-containing protein n=1 Tax=Pontibacter diazotrophicus TaxID=1400979 RepID=A0A3D8L5J1_9BACT|nr:serine hydrolase [Pontibacter diazotrophicus]RDV12617.1 T9SS C-terminal target domain-containing protein [Pontibacter diazotrophicus]